MVSQQVYHFKAELMNTPILMTSEEQRAPWNQKENTPIKVDCCVSCCMSKSMPVEISNYNASDTNNPFSDTNFIEEFNNDSNTYSIPDLLAELYKFSNEKISNLQEALSVAYSLKAKDAIKKELEYYEGLSKASQNWIVDDLDVIKE